MYNNQEEQRRAALGISAAENSTLIWRRPDTCVWAAPGVPYAYTALEGQFTNDCSEDRADSLERFMKATLGIGDWDENCCIQELKHMKGENCDDFDWVVEIYEFLHTCDMSESQLKDFRYVSYLIFNEKCLILSLPGPSSGQRLSYSFQMARRSDGVQRLSAYGQAGLRFRDERLSAPSTKTWKTSSSRHSGCKDSLLQWRAMSF